MPRYRYTDTRGNEHIIEADGYEPSPTNPGNWLFKNPTVLDGRPYDKNQPALLGVAAGEPTTID
jgi:hypothetical protein